MKAKWIGASAVALPLLVGGLVMANSQSGTEKADKAKAEFTCPVTGEELPCPKCCLLNK